MKINISYFLYNYPTLMVIEGGSYQWVGLFKIFVKYGTPLYQEKNIPGKLIC